MSIVLMMPAKGALDWREKLLAHDASQTVHVWPDVSAPEEVTAVISWLHPHGQLQQFPNLQLVASAGAGVEHILNDPSLPPGVALTRVVDPQMSTAMAEFVLTSLLMARRNLPQLLQQQKLQQWQAMRPRSIQRVGILGFGAMGGMTATLLTQHGFDVRAWARTKKHLPHIQTFAGRDALPEFLKELEALVCLLPLTCETRDILNLDLFRLLPTGAVLVNVGRGEHLVERDLITALDAGILGMAILDVFRTEPLPTEHPFWKHPQIIVSPHVAASTDREFAARQILHNLARLHRGEELQHLVNRRRGY